MEGRVQGLKTALRAAGAILVLAGLLIASKLYIRKKGIRRTAINNHSIFLAKAHTVLALSGVIVMNHFRNSGNRSNACS